MLTDEIVTFLFTLALTAVIVRSLVRYGYSARPSARRSAVLVVGGLIALSFLLECFRLLVPLFR
jgi:hypothetical protein